MKKRSIEPFDSDVGPCPKCGENMPVKRRYCQGTPEPPEMPDDMPDALKVVLQKALNSLEKSTCGLREQEHLHRKCACGYISTTHVASYKPSQIDDMLTSLTNTDNENEGR